MKTPICMPTYKRIPYLKQVLEALVKCHGVENFQLVTSEEPEQETRAFLDSFLPTLGLELSRHQNANLLGGNANICKSLRQGFAMGADWVVYLEDDIVLAKDALRFLEWAVQTHLSDPHIIGATAYGSQGEGFTFNADQLSVTSLSNQVFSSWGMALHRTSYERILPVLNKAEGQTKILWDNLLSWSMPANRWLQVLPVVSRAQNIGREEGWSSGQNYDRHLVHGFVSDVMPDYPLVQYQQVPNRVRVMVDVLFAKDRSKLAEKKLEEAARKRTAAVEEAIRRRVEAEKGK